MGKAWPLLNNQSVSNLKGGRTELAEPAIPSFSSVYQDAAQFLQTASDALSHVGAQLSGNYHLQQPAESLPVGESTGEPAGANEQTVIGTLLGLVEEHPTPQFPKGVERGEGSDPAITSIELNVLPPIIRTDDDRTPGSVVHSTATSLQGSPESPQTYTPLIAAIAGSDTTSSESSSSKPGPVSPQPLVFQHIPHSPLAQQPSLALNQQQGATATERETANVIPTLDKLGLVNDLKSDRLVQQGSSPTVQRLVPFDTPIDKLPQFSGPVDLSFLRNQPPATPIAVPGTPQQTVPGPLIINGGLSPIAGEGTQGQHGADSDIRLGSASIKSVQMSHGEMGSSGGETFSGQHPNGSLASSPESHQGSSSNLSQGQSPNALRVSSFEERLQAYQATPPHRLQIDVQLSETARVQVDVAVQQRQVYAGLLMDQPILRNLALQHVPQLEEQLNQNGMELQEFDAQVDQQENSQRGVFEDVPLPSQFETELEEDAVDLVNKDKEMATNQETGLHFVA